jgi:hypothetical protein
VALPVTVIIPAYKSAGTICRSLDGRSVGWSSIRDRIGTAEDRDLWIRLFSAGSAYLLPDFLATYVQEPGGLSRTNLDRDCTNMLRVIHRQAHLLGATRLKRQEAFVRRRWASGYLSQGQTRKALPHAVSRLKSQPYAPEAWWVTFKAAAMPSISRM